jgi:hypothetical protein
MNAAEIVIREVQSDGGFQVRQLLAESIGQARHSLPRVVRVPLGPRRTTLRLKLGHNRSMIYLLSGSGSTAAPASACCTALFSEIGACSAALHPHKAWSVHQSMRTPFTSPAEAFKCPFVAVVQVARQAQLPPDADAA